jgi:hypothetical protein
MPRSTVIAELESRGKTCEPIAEMARFIAASKRGICPGMGKPPRDAVKQNVETDED